MRRQLNREFYIPPHSIKVSDKLSDAVAYLSTCGRGTPRATTFVGKQAKPWTDFTYRDANARERAVTRIFEARREQLSRKAALAAERREWKHSYQVGALFCASWGYDQTNVNWYEVTEVRGAVLIIREIAQARHEEHRDCGKCVPLPGQFIGEARRVRAQERGIRVGHQWASYQAPKIVAGVPTYDATYWSAYA